jgi:hypothetical protein
MLGRINLSPRGQKDAERHTTQDIFNAVDKKDLEESPFVKHFLELGANNWSCWDKIRWCDSWKTAQTSSRQPVWIVRILTLCSCSATTAPGTQE